MSLRRSRHWMPPPTPKTGFYIDLTSSNAFLDERSKGNWTLEVTDVTGLTVTAVLQDFKLRSVGH
ncbi:proprotein convertase P-domain-containing protein [Xanthomonas floridensis]|uniref:Proprotein convertase P-domain-containing protein n=1 Tax=Xanthomonas floridensis TaxID=1843580 RepID=A0ABU5PZG2_9XANT|nr:proprotein convertase P-domain-containing protein [Xanthomonas floridensis]MEA5124807.1 proprotein convertase P-domain-containing protein [Xanthomonas floridensis]MEA5132400.1 proprotein convertase P-domain-containing protein [Xanthomonas floridensis]